MFAAEMPARGSAVVAWRDEPAAGLTVVLIAQKEKMISRCTLLWFGSVIGKQRDLRGNKFWGGRGGASGNRGKRGNARLPYW